MKAVKIIAAFLVFIVLAVASLLGYLGMFSTVAVSEKEAGPYIYAFKKYTGPYSGSGKVFDEVHSELTSIGVTSETGIGVYYDNPAVVDESRLRSDCGTVISEADVVKVQKIKDLAISTIPKGMFITAEFPVKNALSYMLGPIKVYPSFNEHMEGKKYKPAPGIEIYDMKDRKILYLMQVIK